MKKTIQRLINYIRCFFVFRSIIKQKNSHIQSIGKRDDLDILIKNYTKRLFSLEDHIKHASGEFLIKMIPNQITKQFIAVPFIAYTFHIRCCSTLKVVVSFDDDFYVKYKLFEKGISVGEGVCNDFDKSIGEIKKVLNLNKCGD